jgi:DNA-binding transcriptional LysR family regulator
LSEPFYWDDLKAFLAVARFGTLSLAARKLKVNHATVSRRIEALEKSLNLNLFYKTLRGYSLTDAGRSLLESASRIEMTALDIEHNISGPKQVISGSIKIAAAESFSNFFISPRVGEFARTFPQLAIELISVQRLSMSKRDFDLAVAMSPMQEDKYTSERLVDYKLYVYASKAYLDSSEPIRKKEDLIHHHFVGHLDYLSAGRTSSYLDGIDKGVVARVQSSSVHGKIEAVSAGFGLCVLPAYVASSRRELIPVLSQDAFLERSYWIVMRSELAPTRKLRSARDFLVDAVSRAGSLFEIP